MDSLVNVFSAILASVSADVFHSRRFAPVELIALAKFNVLDREVFVVTSTNLP
jgi:hypothetical protein